MKKLKYLLLILFLPIAVFAEEKEYCFYYLEKEYSPKFYEKGKNDKEYPYISDYWVYSDTTKTSMIKPTSEEEHIVKETPILTYQEQEKVRYIIIDQTYSDSKINLIEIEVYNKENKINYEIDCDTCSTEFFSLIQNNKTIYEYNYINDNSKIVIDLKKEYFPDDLTLKVYMSGVDNKIAKFRVTVNNTQDMKDTYYRLYVEKKLKLAATLNQKISEIEHEERYSDEIKEIKGVDDIENAKILNKLFEYTYKTKFYLYYREVPHYIDGYYKDLPGLIKDENQYVETIKEPEKTKNEEQVKEPVPEQVKIEYQTKEVKVPVIQEKLKYITKEVKVEVPKEVEKVIEKEVVKEVEKEEKHNDNLYLRYGIYLVFTPLLRKMLKFNR